MKASPMTTHHRATPEQRLESRIQGEFLEMPGLRLTFDQAQRLWGLDVATCTRVLETLVARGFLSRDAEGRYARPTDRWPAAAFHMAKADLPRVHRRKSL